MELSMKQFVSVALGTAALTAWLAIGPVSPRAVAAQVAAAPAQLTFASPDEAAAALFDAFKLGDQKQLHAVLGPGSEALVNSGDRVADAANHQKFVASYEAQHKLAETAPGRDVLEVGPNDWPLPFPVVQVNGRWQFDSRAGAQEIVNRRIGRNEIAAIRVALTYVDAQRDYFQRSKQAGGTGEYAQRMISTPNRHDGLYWPAAGGESDSPFGPLVAQAVEEGYPGDIVSGRQVPYQGYYFRVVKAQGENAPGGAKSYLAGDRMTEGFALVAWPASFGVSGIMTFVVDQDGVVFQKDLGKGTAAAATAMTRYDPDLTWTRVDVTNN
jgi:hypothetical protein